MDLTAPLNIHWEMTNVCNLHCLHCYQQDDGPRQPLPTGATLSLIAERIIESGAFELTLTGGEPLLVPQLHDLVMRFNEHGIRPHITSNGMLVDKKAADWLAAVDVTFQISIDGATADTHNEIRRSAHAFARAVQGIRHLVARGVPVSIAYCATPANLSEAERVVALGADLGVTRVCIGEVLPYFGSAAVKRSLSFDEASYRTFASALGRTAEIYAGQVEVAVALMSGHRYDGNLRRSPCTALDRDLAILHDGWAYPCPFVRSPEYRLGRVLDESIRTIWLSEVAQRFRIEKAGGAPKHCTIAASPASPVLLELLPTRLRSA